jgi:predicted transposase/invertase (TIGR01784 family)
MNIPFLKLSAWRDIKRQAKLNAETGKILNPTLDVVFKSLFSSQEPDSREALRFLVSDCIHRPVRNISVKNSEILPGYPGGKLFRLDIHASFNDGEEADIEMQVQKTDDDLIARSLVCAARLLADQLKRGSRYLEVKRVYQIIFMDFTLFPGSSMVPRRYSFMEQNEHTQLSDLVELIYYEMPKLKRVVEDFLEKKGNIEGLSSEEKWCIFFKYKQYEQMQPLINELCRKEEGIMLANKRIDKLSRQSDKWALALSRDKAAVDYRSALYASRVKGKEEGIAEGTAKGKAEGIAEGKVEGITEAKAEAARNMKAKGYSVEDIQDITGLSPEQIEKL